MATVHDDIIFLSNDDDVIIALVHSSRYW